jgi:hypothetical protein
VEEAERLSEYDDILHCRCNIRLVFVRGLNTTTFPIVDLKKERHNC